MEYLLWIDDKAEGPYAKTQIGEEVRSGRLARQTLCLREDGSGDWQSLEMVPNLLDEASQPFTNSPVPPASVPPTSPALNRKNIKALCGLCLAAAVIAHAVGLVASNPGPVELEFDAKSTAAREACDAALAAAQSRIWDRAWVTVKLQTAEHERVQAASYDSIAGIERSRRFEKSGPLFTASFILFGAFVVFGITLFVTQPTQPKKAI